MTSTERKIFEIIKSNPMISQQDIASKLDITRSSVGVHISNLKDKGIILGMGYLLPETKYIVVIGGANVDIVGSSNHEIIKNDSNIGIVSISIGGVGRNISENLTRLNIPNYLISAIGDDYNGKKIIASSEKIGIDISQSFIIENERSSSYLALLDNNKDMLYAISDMDIMNKLDADLLERRKRIIQNSSYIVLDANLSDEAIKYVFTNYDKKIIVDTVSTEKSKKFIPFIENIFLIKPNIYELEKLSQMKIKTDADIDSAARKLLSKGLKHLIVTLGEAGSNYYTSNEVIKFRNNEKIQIKNATGAGDAFMAGICFGLMKNKSTRDMVIDAMSAAKISLKSEKTVNSKMSEKLLEQNRKGIIC